MDQVKGIYDCIIVDDDDLDRLMLLSQVRKYPFLRVAGEFESAMDALEHIKANGEPDVLLLDVDMPEMSGLELRRQLLPIPACIFVTSHPEFAIDGFESAALDYIVKPLKADRFAKAMQRLEQFLSIHSKAELLDYTLGADTLFIKEGVNRVKLQLYDIVYLEALKDYTGIVTRQKKFNVLSPLGNLLKEPAFRNFVRIHRSYAIQKHYVEEISSRGVKVNEQVLPIGRSYKDSLEELFLK
ncbi:MAG: response regulator transcription factor [Chitinophagaceae bacterium]|nr:MAG: response regulator transcription factor [Chitinophagaceae bacterium]